MNLCGLLGFFRHAECAYYRGGLSHLLEVSCMTTVKVNGTERTVKSSPDTPLALCAAQ